MMKDINDIETIHGQVVAKANHYMAVPNKDGTRRIVKDSAIRAYETSFALQCKKYRGAMINEPFVFTVKVFFTDNNHDLDNAIKTILDCLQYCKAITNDNLLMKLNAEKGISKTNPRIEYSIVKVNRNLFDC